MRMGIQYYSDENGYPILLQMRLGIQYYSDENSYPILLQWEWVSNITPNMTGYPILLRWEWVSDITPMRMGIWCYSDDFNALFFSRYKESINWYLVNIQSYTQRIRLHRRLFGICFIPFLSFMVPWKQKPAAFMLNHL